MTWFSFRFRFVSGEKSGPSARGELVRQASPPAWRQLSVKQCTLLGGNAPPSGEIGSGTLYWWERRQAAPLGAACDHLDRFVTSPRVTPPSRSWRGCAA